MQSAWALLKTSKKVRGGEASSNLHHRFQPLPGWPISPPWPCSIVESAPKEIDSKSFHSSINTPPPSSSLLSSLPPFLISSSCRDQRDKNPIMGILRSDVEGSLVVSFGEMLIDFMPTVSGVSLADAPAFLTAAGGAPANVAIAVSRLGGRSAFVGKLGDDEFGHMLAGILRDNGVEDGGVVFDDQARTALAFVSLMSDGEREFMFYRHPSADMLLTSADLNLDLITQATIFHYGSISLITEPCRSAHVRAMEAAKEAGALLSYDPNLRLALWPSAEEARTQIMSIWAQADIVKISEGELEFLTGRCGVDDDLVMTLWRPAMKLLLVTLGANGCRYYTNDFRGTVKSIRVKAVDTTGAGDAFVGGMLYKIAADRSSLQDENKLREVLRFANACGAITTTKKGAIPAMPNEAEALHFLDTV